MNRQSRRHPTHPLLSIQYPSNNRVIDKKSFKKHSANVKRYSSIRRKLGAQ